MVTYKIKEKITSNENIVTHNVNTFTHLVRRTQHLLTAVLVSLTVSAAVNNQNSTAIADNNLPEYIAPIRANELHVSGNKISIRGEEFKLYNGIPKGPGNGDKDKPYVEKSPLNIQIADINTPEAANIMVSNMVSNIEREWTRGPLLMSFNKSDAICSYKGLGYYAYQMAINLSGIASAFGHNSPLAERIFWVETPKKCTYINFIKDINTLYQFTQNSAMFYNLNESSFIKAYIDRNDLIHHYRFISYPLKKYYINGHTKTFNIFGQIINIKLDRELYHPLINMSGFPNKEMYCIYRDHKFIYQRHYIPAHGDGSKEFPFVIIKSHPHYYGKGYYSFEDTSVYNGAHIEYAHMINSKNKLKIIYNEVYPNKTLILKEPESNINKVFYCIKTNGYGFIYNQSLLFQNLWKISYILYQDGTIGHPYLSLVFTKPGHYDINNIIIPYVKSEAKYLKFKNIIKKNKFLDAIYTGNPIGYSNNYYNSQVPGTVSGFMLKNIEEEAKRMHGKIVYGKGVIYVEVKGGMLIYNIPGYPSVMSRHKASVLNKKLYENNPALFNNSNVPLKIINGVKFYILHNDKSPSKRDGSQNNPFIAQRGPVGITPFFYQFGGTNMETSEPINGLNLQKFFKALNMQMKPIDRSHILKIKGFLVYQTNSGRTLNFGTVYQPEQINKHYIYKFIEGTPTCFILKSPVNDNWYVNLRPINNINTLDKFYRAITGSNLGPIIFTHDEKYKVKSDGQIIAVSRQIRR